MAFREGTRLGRYELLAPIGKGGMGEVYRARDTKLGRVVAIKTLHAESSGDPAREARFEREARAAGSLNHPNIASVYDAGREGETEFIVSEFIDGESLRALIDRGPVLAPKLIEIALQIAAGLAAAHDAGIVHRDLKPENIMLTRDGRAKILDFGLAKKTATRLANSESTRSGTPTVSADSTDTVSTTPGVVMGTIGYMSPEQVRGEPADKRSDIFSLGAVLYEMAAGKRPFAAGNTVEILSAILRDQPPRFDTSVPSVLDRVVRRCLEKLADHRFQSSADVVAALDRAKSELVAKTGRPSRRLMYTLLAAATAVEVIVLAVAFGDRLGVHPPAIVAAPKTEPQPKSESPALAIVPKAAIAAKANAAPAVTVPPKTAAPAAVNPPAALAPVSTVSPEPPQATPRRGNAKLLAKDREIKALEASLTKARARFGDQHPDVQRLTRMLSILQKQRDQLVIDDPVVKPEPRPTLSRERMDPVTSALAKALSDGRYKDLTENFNDAARTSLNPDLQTKWEQARKAMGDIVWTSAPMPRPNAEFVWFELQRGIVDIRAEFAPDGRVSAFLYWFYPLDRPPDTRAAAPNPAQARQLFEAAVPLSGKGKLEDALKGFNEAIQTDPDLEPAYQARCVNYVWMRQYRNALWDCTHAIRLNGDPRAIRWRGDALAGMEHWEDAVAAFNEAVRLMPGNAAFHLQRSWAYEHLGRYDVCVESATAGLKADSKVSGLWDHRAFCYERLQEYRLAADDVTEFINLTKSKSAADYNRRGALYNQTKDFDRALADFNEAIRLKPDFKNAYNNRGFAKDMLGDPAGAAADRKYARELPQ